MDHFELESIAVGVYERLGFDPARPVSTYILARELLQDPDAITRPPTLLGRYPATTFLQGEERRPKIAVRRTVPDDEAGHLVGHELGHLLLGRPHGSGADIEAACDYLGACLVAPRPSVVAMFRAFGWSLRRHAAELGSTQTLAGLRIAETLRMPLAAVGPVVRVRGPEEWAWPDESTIRRWAAGRPGPGLKKVRITDRPKRAVLAG